MACLFGHKWDGCKCTRCGKLRNEQHNWKTCKCYRCGKEITKTDINDLTDQNTLLNIVKTTSMLNTRFKKNGRAEAIAIATTAIEKIIDQNILADIAKNSYIEKGIAAMKRIEDHSVLIDILTDDKFFSYNFKKVNDLSSDVFLQIAKNRDIKRDKRVSAFLLIENKSVFSADELRELKELQALEKEQLWDNYSVNTLPTQGWEYS